jgi:hypothetical protein
LKLYAEVSVMPVQVWRLSLQTFPVFQQHPQLVSASDFVLPQFSG